MQQSPIYRFYERVSTSKAATYVTTSIDQYGLAYTFASRLLGVSIVGGLYAMLRQGMDVQAWLEEKGWGGIGEVAGTWSAAVVLSSAMYPFSVVGTAYAAPVIGDLVTSRIKA